jgi:hypothetical protein
MLIFRIIPPPALINQERNLCPAETKPSPSQNRSPNRKVQLRRAAERDNAARKERIFSDLVLGMTHAAIARHENCSLQTVRRTIARELASRCIDPAEDYVKLQIERLNGALAAAHGKMLDGDMAGLDRVLKVIAELDRYHGLPRATRRRDNLDGQLALRAGPQSPARAVLPAPEAKAEWVGDIKFAPQLIEKT